jgi:four helix bundle protein
MAKAIKTYRDLDAWKVSMDLVELVYQITKEFPKDETYGLRAQIRSCAVSIPSNIAEGHGRKGVNEFLHHLSFSNGSLNELETQLIIAVRLKYIEKPDAEKAWDICQNSGRLINGLIRSLNNSKRPNA